MSLSRRSIILALGSMPLLTRGVSSGTTVKAPARCSVCRSRKQCGLYSGRRTPEMIGECL
jgi:hypothetical protein